jgi:hypothetical protein
MSANDRVDVLLVAGGRWHDVDYARAQLLDLLVAHDVTRTTVVEDYEDLALLDRDNSVLVTWTCDVRPTPEQATALDAFVRRGGRWLALHASNSALDVTHQNGRRRFAAPRVLGPVAELLGSQFLAHPPIGPFTVQVRDPGHPLVAGISDFTTTDELYVCELHEPITTLLSTSFSGSCPSFLEGQDVSGDWPVLHLKQTGAGTVCVFTLGHCRGRWDVQDLGVEDLVVIDRVAWEPEEYLLLLRRLVSWAVHGDSWSDCEKAAA